MNNLIGVHNYGPIFWENNKFLFLITDGSGIFSGAGKDLTFIVIFQEYGISEQGTKERL